MPQGIVFSFAMLLATSSAPAQAANPTPPACTFDVVSIHRSPDDSPYLHPSFSPDWSTFKATSFTAQDMLQFAYRIRDARQIVGYPDWATTERFDIIAKVSEEQVANKCLSDYGRAMEAFKVLLQQRFALKVHQEQRQLEIYGLWTIPGKLKLTPSEPTPEQAARGDNGSIVIYPPFTMTALHATTTSLASAMFRVLDRYVIDRTGLTDRYTFKLKYAPDDAAMASFPEYEGRSSIFATLQDQLGLKLIPEKALMPVSVIDHIEHPSAN